MHTGPAAGLAALREEQIWAKADLRDQSLGREWEGPLISPMRSQQEQRLHWKAQLWQTWHTHAEQSPSWQTGSLSCWLFIHAGAICFTPSFEGCSSKEENSLFATFLLRSTGKAGSSVGTGGCSFPKTTCVEEARVKGRQEGQQWGNKTRKELKKAARWLGDPLQARHWCCQQKGARRLQGQDWSGISAWAEEHPLSQLKPECCPSCMVLTGVQPSGCSSCFSKRRAPTFLHLCRIHNHCFQGQHSFFCKLFPDWNYPDIKVQSTFEAQIPEKNLFTEAVGLQTRRHNNLWGCHQTQHSHKLWDCSLNTCTSHVVLGIPRSDHSSHPTTDAIPSPIVVGKASALDSTEFHIYVCVCISRHRAHNCETPHLLTLQHFKHMQLTELKWHKDHSVSFPPTPTISTFLSP